MYLYILRRYDDWHDGTPYQVLDPSWITVKKSHVRPSKIKHFFCEQ